MLDAESLNYAITFNTHTNVFEETIATLSFLLLAHSFSIAALCVSLTPGLFSQWPKSSQQVFRFFLAEFSSFPHSKLYHYSLRQPPSAPRKLSLKLPLTWFSFLTHSVRRRTFSSSSKRSSALIPPHCAKLFEHFDYILCLCLSFVIFFAVCFAQFPQFGCSSLCPSRPVSLPTTLHFHSFQQSLRRASNNSFFTNILHIQLPLSLFVSLRWNFHSSHYPIEMI